MSDRKAMQVQAELKNICADFLVEAGFDWICVAKFSRERFYQVICSEVNIEKMLRSKKEFTKNLEAMEPSDFIDGFIFKELEELGKCLTFQKIEKENCYFFMLGLGQGLSQLSCELPFIKKFCSLGIATFNSLFQVYQVPKMPLPFKPKDEKREVRQSLQMRLLIELIQAKSLEVKGQLPFQVSDRELECIKYLLQNKTAKEVAKALNLSHRTVEHYYERLKQKLNLPNKAALKALFLSDNKL